MEHNFRRLGFRCRGVLVLIGNYIAASSSAAATNGASNGHQRRVFPVKLQAQGRGSYLGLVFFGNYPVRRLEGAAISSDLEGFGEARPLKRRGRRAWVIIRRGGKLTNFGITYLIL
ncbi:hypothetical protein U1Q18_023606, partial [Sarracenia purpurea var. burkii]